MRFIVLIVIASSLVALIPASGHALPFLGGEIGLKIPKGAAVQLINDVRVPLIPIAIGPGDANFEFDYFYYVEDSVFQVPQRENFGFVSEKPAIVQPFLINGDSSSFLVDVFVRDVESADTPNFADITIRSHGEKGGVFDFSLGFYTQTQLYDHLTGEFIYQALGQTFLRATGVPWSHTAPLNYPDRELNPGGNFYVVGPMNLTVEDSDSWGTEVYRLLPIGIPEPGSYWLVLSCLFYLPLARGAGRAISPRGRR